jgi:CheY-like chemotaxis protein
MTKTRPILYAEDDENDSFLVTRAVQQAALPNPLVVVPDGAEAIQYLAGAGSYSDRSLHPLPSLAIVDLNLPGKSGFEVLRWIREAEDVKTLPVLILTSSNQESDVQQAYLQGANGYLVKPDGPDDLLAMVKSIQAFWFEQNRLPRIPT